MKKIVIKRWCDKENEILIKRIDNIKKNPNCTIPWRKVKRNINKLKNSVEINT